jgi:hypothetical protein
MREEIKSGQAEVASTVNAFQEKEEPNPGEKEAVVERQEMPNEEAAIHSLRACQKEMMASQETMEACPG